MTNEKLGFVVSDYNADITHLMSKIGEEHDFQMGAYNYGSSLKSGFIPELLK